MESDNAYRSPAPTSGARWQPGLLVALALAAPASLLPDGLATAMNLWDVSEEMEAAIASYDDTFDPVRVRDGKVEVLGPRLIDSKAAGVHDGPRILVDPGETVSTEELEAGGEYAVVRSDRIIQRQSFRRREFLITEMQQAFGFGDVTIDGTQLRSWWATTGKRWLVYLGVGWAGMTASFVYVGLLMQAVVLGPAVRLLKKSDATLPGSVGVALVASLVPQMLVVMGREAVVDPGFVLRSLVVAALTLPIVWAWLPGPQKEA